MLADLKPKRKQAGFIRTSSSKALPTFKLPQPEKKQSSDDFSSFENQRPPEDSQGEFSPYKHPAPNFPNRPPLPQKSKHAQQFFSNEKLKKNYQTSAYNPPQFSSYNQQPQSTKHARNNFIDSPNRGKIVNMKQVDAQTRQIYKRRAEVQRELAEIDKICNQIGQMKSPTQSFKSRYEKIINYIETPESVQKPPQYGNKSRSKEKGQISLSREKQPAYKFQQQQPEQEEISFDSHHKPKQPQILKNLPKENYNNFAANKYKSPTEPHQQKQQKETPTLNPHIKAHTYQFQQSDISSNSEEEQSSYHYQTTFKQKPKQTQQSQRQQILNSIQQYKKLHPDQRNLNGSRQKSNQSHKKFQSKEKQSNKLEPNEGKNIKYEHERARERFISQKQSSRSNSQAQYQPQQQQGQQELIQQYPKEQFKQKTIKQVIQSRQNNPYNYNKIPKQQRQVDKELQTKPGLYKTKGGICFDLDINQFTQTTDKNQRQKTVPKQRVQGTRRNKKVNIRQEILKRRQMAKNYDRQARARVFGEY